MNCEKYLILIDDLIDGELENQNYGLEVNTHLLDCPECAAYYRTVQREKEIYAGYLSAVEPSIDLWAKFQAKMESEFETVLPVPETAAAAGWKINFLKIFRLAPAIGFTVFLFVFGFGLLKYRQNKNEQAARKELNNSPTAFENYEKQSPQSPTENNARKTFAPPNFAQINGKNETSARRTNNRIFSKPVAIKAMKTSDKRDFDDSKKDSTAQIQLNQKQLQLAALEKDAARQIEKTELMLRSFRNARATEDVSTYDLEYERQQARKLLAENVKLRQIAEGFGDLYTQEILDRIEPFLLDIANLEKSPASEKVLEIRNRVKNQNIIANLQTY